MLEVTMSEFTENIEKLTIGAIKANDFVKIRTRAGNAVLISETEWDILRDSLKMVMDAL